jgi:hypothetical protein
MTDSTTTGKCERVDQTPNEAPMRLSRSPELNSAKPASMSNPTTPDDWADRPTHLRQIADELDEDAEQTPCSQASICREAADEIEMWRELPSQIDEAYSAWVRFAARYGIACTGADAIPSQPQRHAFIEAYLEGRETNDA